MGSAEKNMCLEVHRCCSLPGCSSGLVFWFYFGMRPYMNLLQLCASAVRRLRSLREEPGRRLERHSSLLLFRKELQCNTQSCYALLEEVSRR